MVSKTNQKLLLGAAGTLAVGALAAVQIAASRPVAAVAETGTLRQLAQRLADEPAPVVRPVVPPARFTPVQTESRPRPIVRRTVAASQPPRQPQAPAPNIDTPSQQAIADAVKNIALMGVTHMGDDDQVWLVDISNNERQVAEQGEDAFGFKVMQIEDESVVLTRGSDRWELKLGEKQIPSTTPEPAFLTSDTGMGGFPGGRDGRGFGGWGGMRGNGGGGGRSWNRGGGGSGGGRSSWSGSSSRSNRRGWGNTGFRPTFSATNRGGFGGGGFGGFNQGNRNSAAQLSTSNPQTARRRGSRLVGGADPMPTPATVSNPQTVRRRGSSSGSAFGDNSNSSRNQNRNGNQARRR